MLCLFLLLLVQDIFASWTQSNRDSHGSRLKPVNPFATPLRCWPSLSNLNDVPTSSGELVVDSRGNLYSISRGTFYSTNLFTEEANYPPVMLTTHGSTVHIPNNLVVIEAKDDSAISIVVASISVASSGSFIDVLLFVLNADTGEILWNCTVNKTLAEAGNDRRPMLVHPDGFVLISFYTRVDAFQPPTQISTNSYDSMLLWSYSFSYEPSPLMTFVTPALVNPGKNKEILILSGVKDSPKQSAIVFLDPAHGSVVKEVLMEGIRSAKSLTMVTENNIYLLNVDRGFSGLIVSLGVNNTITATPMIASAAGPRGTVIFSKFEIISLRQDTEYSKVLWEVNLPIPNVTMQYVTVDGNGVIYSYATAPLVSSTSFFGLNLADGRFLWQQPATEDMTPLVISDGKRDGKRKSFFLTSNFERVASLQICGIHGIQGKSCNSACVCKDEWFGPKCDVFCVANDTCHGHGSCNSTTGVCDCQEFFLGKTCDVNCDRATTCSGNGDCKGDGSCECQKTGFFDLHKYDQPDCVAALNWRFAGFLIAVVVATALMAVAIIVYVVKMRQSHRYQKIHQHY